MRFDLAVQRGYQTALVSVFFILRLHSLVGRWMPMAFRAAHFLINIQQEEKVLSARLFEISRKFLSQRPLENASPQLIGPKWVTCVILVIGEKEYPDLV